MNCRKTLLVCLVAVFSASLVAQATPPENEPCVSDWVPTFGGLPGTNALVSATLAFNESDRIGPTLFVGGRFKAAGGRPSNYIARWRSEEGWIPFDVGMNGYVECFTVFDDGTGPALYAGGSFTSADGVSANRIAKWDGKSWSPLGQGISGGPGSVIVYAMRVFDDGLGGGPALYVGGAFTGAGNISATNIAKWDGKNWSATGSMPFVYTLEVYDNLHGSGSHLYAGTSGGVREWSGTSWLDSSPNLSGNVFSLKTCRIHPQDSPEMYAGGSFSNDGGSPANYVAKWDGSTWKELSSSSGPSYWVESIEAFDDGRGTGVYIGGNFELNADGFTSHGIAKWNGSSWEHIAGNSAPVSILAMTVLNDDISGSTSLITGGALSAIGNVSAKNIAKWDGKNWSGLGSSINDTVLAIKSCDLKGSGSSQVYVGGEFTHGQGAPLNGIAQWDGTNWKPLGAGLDRYAYALQDRQERGVTSLIVGGNFRMAGGVARRGIARWSGDEWSDLGSGVDAVIFAMCNMTRPDGVQLLYAGGITYPGSVLTGNIGMWDGQNWSHLGTGLPGTIYAMAIHDDHSGHGESLYVGGTFQTAGGLPAKRIVRWDGNSWSTVGAGMDNTVYALSVFDDGTGSGPSLFAGGQFLSAGNNSAMFIAKWDGQNWLPVGDGLPSMVRALARSNHFLYAGGHFSSGTSIQKWDGISWIPLRSGFDDTVQALAIDSSQFGGNVHLIAGGDFTVSPSNDSYIAQWIECAESTTIPGDANSDGIVNVSDLLAVIANWAPCPAPPQPCLGDVAPSPTGDGQVNAIDLLMVINNWT